VEFVLTWLRLIVALAFLEAFWVHVREFGRLQRVMRELVSTSTVALPVTILDVVTGVLLLLGSPVGALIGVAFLGASTGVTTYRVLRGQTIDDCGCAAKPHPVDITFFLRNFSYAAILLAALMLPSFTDAPSVGSATALALLWIALPRLVRHTASRGIDSAAITS
jgi:hypothetical protein